MLAALAAVAGPAGAATTSNRPLGTSGSVAALSGSSMEVQSASSGQTTVTWTSTTTFSKTVSQAVSTLAAGDCVSVTGTASKKSKTTIAARSITVTTPASGGLCTNVGFGSGANGAFGGRGGGTPPQGAPQGGETGGSRPSFPDGGARALPKQLASLSVATGQVTAVIGSTVTLTGSTFSPGGFAGRGVSSSGSSTQAKKPATPKKEQLMITTSSSTTVSTTQSATASELAVGDCVSAFGPAASNGAVTATTVRIISTGGGTCGAGIGGFPGGGFPGGPGGPRGSGGSGSTGA